MSASSAVGLQMGCLSPAFTWVMGTDSPVLIAALPVLYPVSQRSSLVSIFQVLSLWHLGIAAPGH